MDMTLSARTEQELLQLVQSRPQSIGIVAPKGAGKTVIARRLAAELLGITPETLDTYPYFYTLEPEPKKTSASVEAVRALLARMNRAVPGTHPTRRIVLLEHADTLLRADAQNVLLKFIEEPPAETIVILTYASETALLPTVRSRLQAMNLVLPTRDEVTAYFVGHGQKPVDIARAYGLSGGLPGMMSALLEGKDHPLLAAVERAKALLAADTFERLVMVDTLAKEDLSDLFFAFRQIARASLSGATQKADSDRMIRRWTRIYALAEEAETQRAGHVQTKLLLTNFVLQL